MPKITSLNLEIVKKHFPDIHFEESDVFYFSPQEKTIYFNPLQLNKKIGIFQLLHEIGHALCDHKNYQSGVALIKMEVEAWEAAKKIATNYDTTIPKQHIEKCLDSYRDWLHLRSTCPGCGNIATEINENQYQCFNCLQKWNVPESQQTRLYRKIVSSS